MLTNHSVLKKFKSIHEAEELASFLKEHDVDPIVENNIPNFDVTFANNTINQDYIVYVSADDFDSANKILEVYSKSFLADLPADHYLYDFTEEELMEVITNKDEWSEIDFHLARKLLADKGIEFGEDEIEKFRAEKLAKEIKPKELKTGAFVAWLIASILFPLIGLVIGSIFWTSKKQLLDGKRYYVYDKRSRVHGRDIVIVSASLVIILVFIKIYSFSGS
jgi:hypothetical protein